MEYVQHPNITKAIRLGAPEPKSNVYCECGCKEIVQIGEKRYEWDGEMLCIEHWKEKIEEAMEIAPDILADMMQCNIDQITDEGAIRICL